MNISYYILLITIAITSCSKDNKKYCWQCESNTVVLGRTYKEICDKTQYEINEIELQYAPNFKCTKK
jgi:hypothetical protein